MQSVKLKSIKDIGGFVSYCVTDSGLYVEWDTEPSDSTEELTAYLMSSRRPLNVPITFRGKSTTIPEDELVLKGYNASDIDTFALALASNYELVAVGYSGLMWDISFKCKEIGNTQRDYALVRGDMLLKKIKRPPEDIHAYSKIVQQLKQCEKTLTASDVSVCKGYRWYKLTTLEMPVKVSAYNHLISPDEFKDAFTQSGELLFGIGSPGRTALAVKSSKKNPFVTAEDCTVRKGEYYVVGVSFAPDGQYFEKIPPTE